MTLWQEEQQGLHLKSSYEQKDSLTTCFTVTTDQLAPKQPFEEPLRRFKNFIIEIKIFAGSTFQKSRHFAKRKLRCPDKELDQTKKRLQPNCTFFDSNREIKYYFADVKEVFK